MATIMVQLRSIPDTEAAVGWSGGHPVVIDRPAGKAGGMGLGFNGGQMLALAIGGCFCNDLRYVAHDMGISLASIEVDVSLDLEGMPLVATRAVMHVRATAAEEGTDVDAVIRRAQEISTVANSSSAVSRWRPSQESRHKQSRRPGA
jgi:organic hydroperoxide reductase OsmC/OhrA